MAALSEPLVCPIVVGRETESAELEAIAARVEMSGSGTVVLVAGEAGVGKSRLLRAAAEGIAQNGWRVFQASCHEQDRGLPFALIINLAEEIRAAYPAEASAILEPAAEPLARLLPELGVSEVASPSGDPEQERRRLFTAMTAVLERQASAAPCLLLAEDLHWADEGSLDFLAAIARAASRVPLLVVATYRSDEVDAALRSLLSTLDRERLAAELRLRPLAPRDVAAMVAATVPAAAHRLDVIDAVTGLADGIPFYVEELLRSMLEGDAPGGGTVGGAALEVPRTVSEALQRRLAALSEEARELLVVAAVIGDRFDLDLLEVVAEHSGGELLGLLRELAGQQLLVEAGEDEFRFRHALTREAVLRTLLGRERREMHARVAAALEAQAPDRQGYAGDLAYHHYEAAAWDRAGVYAKLAGEQALAMHAPASALAQFTRAIEAGRRAGEDVAPELYLQRARAHDLVGNLSLAHEDLQQALAAAEASADRGVLIDTLIELGLFWASTDYQQALPHLERAVEVGREAGDPVRLSRALNRVGNWYSNVGNYPESRRYLDESLALLRDAGDERATAETLDLLGMACLQGARFEDSLRYLRESSELFERLGDRRRLASALSTQAVVSGTYQTSMLPARHSLAESVAVGETAVALAREAGGLSDVSYSLWQLSFCLGPSGAQARAIEAAQEALSIAEQIEHRQWAIGGRCALGAVYADLLQFDVAAPLLERACADAVQLASDTWVSQAADLLARTLIALGRLDDAAERLAAGAAIGGDGGVGAIAGYWLAAANAELAFARSEHDRALEIVDEEFGAEAGVRMRSLRGRALVARGDLEDGIEELESALGLAMENGDTSSTWRIEAALAHARMSLDDRDAARMHARRALEVVATIAEALPDAELAASFRKRAALWLPATLRPRGERPEEQPLSARELEVARLVARGLSNRAIADELVLSVRTVETHVANAMNRLGYTSRSQLAAWVVQQGLLDSPAP